jgi:hypothetical protein
MVFFGAMAALAPSAHAQEKMAVGAGYQFSHVSFSEGSTAGINLNGFFLDLSGGLPQKTGSVSWGWTGELTGGYSGTDGHAYTYTVGGKGFFDVNPKLKPYVELQIGGITEGGQASNASSDSAFLILLGGGARIPLMGQKFDALVKIDYGHAFYNTDHGGGQNIIRVGAGVAIPIPLK